MINENNILIQLWFSVWWNAFSGLEESKNVFFIHHRLTLVALKKRLTLKICTLFTLAHDFTWFLFILILCFPEPQYAPYKPGHKGSLAERAKALGLEPAAMSILSGKMINFESFIKPGEKGTETKNIHVLHPW